MIHYLTGDATDPQGTGNKIIAHVCNDVGGWGRGFVLAISKRWKEPELMYRHWHARGECPLGMTGFVPVKQTLDELVMVANMVAQVGYGANNTNLHRSVEQDATPPIRYEALRSCLIQVAEEARTEQCSVHMPRIGCGLAGGKWEEVEPIINETLDGIDVFVYDLPVQG